MITPHFFTHNAHAMNHTHALSVVIHSGGRNYRVTCKHVLFQKRCLHCTMSCMSRRFCYAIDIGPTYPHLPQRIKKAHGYPCVDEAFNAAENLNSFMRVNVFQDLCCTPILVQIDSFTWTEDEDAFAQRVADFNSLPDDWDEAKEELFRIVAGVKSSWFNSRHDSTCDDDRCKTCASLRQKLRRLFSDFVQKGFEDRVYQSFVSSVIIDNTIGYEDDRVRIIALE